MSGRTRYLAGCFVWLVLGMAPNACAQEAVGLPDAQAGKPYSFEIKTEGGLAPLAWRVVGGQLPGGLHLSSGGVIEGTPTPAGREAFTFVVEVSDSSTPKNAYTQPFTLAVRPAPLRMVTGSQRPLKVIAPPTGALQARPALDADAGRPIPDATSAQSRPGGEPQPSSAAPVNGAAQPATAGGTSNGTAAPSVISAPQYSLSEAMGSASPHFAARGPATSDAGTNDKNEAKNFSPSEFVCIYEDTTGGDRFWMYRPNSAANCSPPERGKGKTTPVKMGTVSEGGTRLLSADESSTLVITLDPKRMGSTMAFNKLFITAKLASGDQSRDLEVEGYSKIGVSKDDTSAQRGVAFESAQNVQAKIARMAELAEDLLRTVLGIPPYVQVLDLQSETAQAKAQALRSALAAPSPDKKTDNQQPKAPASEPAVIPATWSAHRPAKPSGNTSPEQQADTPTEVSLLKENLQLHRQEITAIADYLAASENYAIVQIVANDVLQQDAGSLIAAATQVKADLATALDSTSKADAANAALLSLWDRNVDLYRHFAPIHARVAALEATPQQALTESERAQFPKQANQLDAASRGANGAACLDEKQIGAMTPVDRQNCAALRQAAINVVAAELGAKAVAALKKLFAQGSISLRANKAKPGDIVTLTVQAMGVDGATVGIPSVWEVEVKAFGLKHSLPTDSLLFLYRLGIGYDETHPANPNTGALNAIIFAPSPGVTLSMTFYKRGNSAGDKFLRGLAPGLGVNVSFMNFNDAGFDLSTQRFTNTTGTTVQVGTGTLFSLFDNAIQFTNGWNLNVDRKRAYFGVGFSFVKFTEKVAAIIKKSS